MSFPNPIPPSRLTAAEQLDEIAEILAAGIRRLRHESPALYSAMAEKVASTTRPTNAVMRPPENVRQQND